MKTSESVAPALIVIVLGLWLLAEESSSFPLRPEEHWPLLIIAAGAAFLLGYLLGAGPWQLFLGVLALGSGLVLLPFSLGLTPWRLLEGVWPCFLIAFGAAILAYLAATPVPPLFLLVPGLAGIFTGLTGLLYALGAVPYDPLQQMRSLWPLVLVATGLLGLAQALALR
jgi:hypothetical protein